jgi:exosome complex component RRP46
MCSLRLTSQKNLAIVPALLHASILSLLTAAIPLKGIATATTLAIPSSSDDGSITVEPSARDAETAKSLHVLGFTSGNELLLAESQGSFTVEEWDKVLEAGQRVCCQSQDQNFDTTMAGGGLESASIKAFLRSAMETKIAGDLHWK